MQRCDYASIMEIVRGDLMEGAFSNQLEFVDSLFSDYLEEGADDVFFDASQVNKWFHGTLKPSPAMCSFYISDEVNQDALADSFEEKIIPCLSDPMIIGWGKTEKEVFSMTRKQALTLAIQALSEIGQHKAAEILHTLSDELPLNRWSDAAIRDSVEQFILDHGRVPTVSDFKRRGLPPHTVITHRYGITLRQWLDENYPAAKPSEEEIRAKINEAFVRDYLRIRPKNADEFNARRTPNSPCWYTVAVHNHTKRWRGLLETLELPIYSGVDVPRDPTVFRVNVYTHYDFRDG